MLKREVIAKIVSGSGRDPLKRDVVERVLSLFAEAIADGLNRDGTVVVQGIGTFVVRYRKARSARDLNGRRITIPASFNVGFRPSKRLRKAIK